tara:strand:- start:66414 stop:67412 length:999 start_codon:yes stop_codon:yes gene_type:complete
MQVLRILGFPISLIYALVVHIRNFLFDIGFFTSKEFKTTTVCVGNLSVGGTGKTPMIEYLIHLFKAENKIAVLSRGYGRKSKGFLLANEKTTVENLGDEPYQIHAKFPEIIIAVDGNRQNGISILEKNAKPDLILLDDAFQHRKVKPTFSILLTAFDNLYSNDWYLPTGTLRDSKREAKRANLIIVTKCPDNLEEIHQINIIQRLKPHPNQQILFAYLKYDKVLKGLSENLNIKDLKTKKITLVTGIANPKPLLQFLNKNELTVEHLNYRDHHFFTKDEIAFFNTKEFVITTEKDYVRLQGKVTNLAYIAIEHQFIGEGREVVKQALMEAVT